MKSSFSSSVNYLSNIPYIFSSITSLLNSHTIKFPKLPCLSLVLLCKLPHPLFFYLSLKSIYFSSLYFLSLFYCSYPFSFSILSFSSRTNQGKEWFKLSLNPTTAKHTVTHSFLMASWE